MKEHLTYREENKEKVKEFHVTRTLGPETKIYFDEDKGWFLVTNDKNYREKNPVVLEFSQITIQVENGSVQRNSAEYRQAEKACEEIKKVFNKMRTQARAASEEKPKTAVQCPYCGASTMPDENGKCEYCGGAII